MKNFFKKILLVALIFINATLVFAQDENLDSILNIIDEKVKINQYDLAQTILDSLKETSSYRTDAAIFKIDLVQTELLRIQKKDQEALSILLNGLKKSSSRDFDNYAADYAFEIGRLFSSAKDYPKAFEYYGKSREFAEKGKDSLKISKSNLGIGSVHLKIYQRFKQGIQKMDSLVMKTHRDSSIFYHSKAISVFPRLEKNKKFLGTLNRNLMIFYFYEEEYEQAEMYAQPTLRIFEEMSDTIAISRTLNVMGAIKLGLLDFKESEQFYQQGFGLIKNKRDFESTRLRRSFLTNLSQIYGELKEFEKAYDYRTQAYFLRDSLYDLSTNIELEEVVSKYNFSEKEKQAEIEKNKRQKAEFLLYVFVGSTGVLMLFLWLVYRNQKFKREKKALEFQKENLLQERKIEIVQNETQIKILNATIDGKESERKQIAEILHNSVSALLSSAGLHLQAAKIELKENAPDEIEKSQSIISEAGEKIRDLSHKLISSVLLKFGLSYATHDLCEKYSNSKLVFESNSKDIQRFSSEFEIKIHSIIEELINNIIKHSNANNANILLKQYDGRLQVRIYDDGDGFDVEKMRENISGGLGLTQIEARIKMMEGIFDIKSSKETGTRIFMDVPIPESN